LRAGVGIVTGIVGAAGSSAVVWFMLVAGRA
jgi:hypothetical protein